MQSHATEGPGRDRGAGGEQDPGAAGQPGVRVEPIETQQGRRRPAEGRRETRGPGQGREQQEREGEHRVQREETLSEGADGEKEEQRRGSRPGLQQKEPETVERHGRGS